MVHISVHSIPAGFPLKNATMLEKWEKAVRRINKDGSAWKATSYSFICSDHFKASDYVTPPSHGVSCRLKPPSIPSVFPGFPSYLQQTECRMNPRP